MKNGTASFLDEKSADISPLAKMLFMQNGVEGVFLGADFITVAKSPEGSWDLLKPHLLTTIMEHFLSGADVITTPEKKLSSNGEVDDEIVLQIKEILDTRVRPAVAEDGGDIVFYDFRDGVVYLEMHGACSGCPGASITLKSGIENLLKHYIPEVESVEAVNDEPMDL